MNRTNRLHRLSAAAVSSVVSSVATPIESLEGRRLFATLFAYSNADSGAGSLRNVIAAANANDTIDMTQLTGTIDLASTITIDKSLTIVGPGADVLAIDGDDVVRLFEQTAGDVTLSDVTLSNGHMAGFSSGGAWNAMSASCNASFERIEFESNYSANGGAIFFESDTLTVANCTFVDNSSLYGGAINVANSTATITNSTFTQNAGNYGGAIISQTVALTISDTTIVDNTGLTGGGLYVTDAPYTMSRTIIANNTANNNANLYFSNATATETNNLIGVDPLLGTFADHGGTTRTYSLLANSPAIDEGGANDNSLDQRGFPRVGDRDIGAYEFNSVDPNANELPVWTTASLNSAALGVPYSMTIAFTDADSGDTLNVALGGFPDSFSFEDHGDGTATITGVAQMNDVGTHSVMLMAGDGTATVDQTLSFYIGAPVGYRSNGTLYINGTDVADDIDVWIRNDEIRLTRGTKTLDFPLAGIDEVKVIGYGDNDNIAMNVRSIPTRLSGGAGNDTLMGAGGVDRIYGDEGDDYIDAGADRNWAWGGDGDDTLIGGNSIDRFYGGTGNDLFVSRGKSDFIDGGYDTDTALDASDTRVAVEVLA